jgi:hypothetical protein
MIDLLIALGIGMVIGYLLKGEQEPPLVEILQAKCKQYEKDIIYYKDLCKWHAERKK